MTRMKGNGFCTLAAAAVTSVATSAPTRCCLTPVLHTVLLFSPDSTCLVNLMLRLEHQLHSLNFMAELSGPVEVEISKIELKLQCDFVTCIRLPDALCLHCTFISL